METDRYSPPSSSCAPDRNNYRQEKKTLKKDPQKNPENGLEINRGPCSQNHPATKQP